MTEAFIVFLFSPYLHNQHNYIWLVILYNILLFVTIAVSAHDKNLDGM